MLRALQDETRGFLTYIPLAYHPDHNELGEELGRVGTATTGYEDLRNIAVARLFLDNVPHVKTHWPMVTPFLSQIALSFGCDDVEGTVVYERVYHEAGAQTQMHMPYLELVRLIRGAGSGRSSATACTPGARAVRRPAARAVGAPRREPAGGARRMRLGRIPWINCYPVYGAIDRGVVPVTAELVTGTASELNDLLAAGELQVSVVSASNTPATRQPIICCPTLPSPVMARSTASRCSRAGRSRTWTGARCFAPRRRGLRCCCST
jgi:Thiamine biosynthesis enzyme ThiH and related uncharacterized enzymes